MIPSSAWRGQRLSRALRGAETEEFDSRYWRQVWGVIGTELLRLRQCRVFGEGFPNRCHNGGVAAIACCFISCKGACR